MNKLEAYEKYQLERKEFLKATPMDKDPDETLNIIIHIYKKLKEKHIILPKLKKKTFRLTPNKCKGSLNARNVAHSHRESKQVCFSNSLLKRQKDYTDILNDDNWQVYEGTFMLIELVTHEITHWLIQGSHNQRFYARQTVLFMTLINMVISGEFYR